MLREIKKNIPSPRGRCAKPSPFVVPAGMDPGSEKSNTVGHPHFLQLSAIIIDLQLGSHILFRLYSVLTHNHSSTSGTIPRPEANVPRTRTMINDSSRFRVRYLSSNLAGVPSTSKRHHSCLVREGWMPIVPFTVRMNRRVRYECVNASTAATTAFHYLSLFPMISRHRPITCERALIVP